MLFGCVFIIQALPILQGMLRYWVVITLRRYLHDKLHGVIGSKLIVKLSVMYYHATKIESQVHVHVISFSNCTIPDNRILPPVVLVSTFKINFTFHLTQSCAKDKVARLPRVLMWTKDSNQLLSECLHFRSWKAAWNPPVKIICSLETFK